jgi:ribonuclease III
MNPSEPSSVSPTPAVFLDTGERDSDGKIELCQEILDYRFKDVELLRSALTHASGASSRLASNERLEFLGDAVLGLTICHWLFEKFPQYSEGDLTKIKSAVVSRRSCATIASKLGFDRCLIVGRGVTRNRSFPRSLVSDVFEAVIAAMFLDGGPDVICKRIRVWLDDEVRLAIASRGAGNFKSALQQLAQRDFGVTPSYCLIRETGPDHRKTFLIAATIGAIQYPAAWGNNKKDAEQRAAANAMAQLRGEAAPFSDQPSDSGDHFSETSAN